MAVASIFIILVALYGLYNMGGKQESTKECNLTVNSLCLDPRRRHRRIGHPNISFIFEIQNIATIPLESKAKHFKGWS